MKEWLLTFKVVIGAGEELIRDARAHEGSFLQSKTKVQLHIDIALNLNKLSQSCSDHCFLDLILMLREAYEKLSVCS